MSAFAAHRTTDHMTCRAVRSPLPSITVRLSARDKEWFSTLARTRGVSESALALTVIRSISDSGSLDPYATGPRAPATDRITIRLRPGDGAVVAKRAEARGMKASTYLAALVRSHVSANPPLPKAELAALKEAITVLGAVGHLLARTARAPSLSGAEGEELGQSLSRTRAVVAALERRAHDLVRAALISWETHGG